MSSSGTPSISVVIPTYNCASLLPRAIRSAYDQTLPPDEVVVVNDGSTDDTAEVLERLARELPANFVYENKPNGGEASGRNRGLELAKGDFVAFIDQDDVWRPDEARAPDEALRAGPGARADLHRRSRGSAARPRRPSVRTGWDPAPEHALRELMIGCCITPSTVVARRDVLDAAGPFDESLWLGCDWTMWLNVATNGQRIGYEPEPLTDYYVHDTNMSADLSRIAKAALVIFPRLFSSGRLPDSIQRLERWCYARWHMISAAYSLDAGESKEATRPPASSRASTAGVDPPGLASPLSPLLAPGLIRHQPSRSASSCRRSAARRRCATRSRRLARLDFPADRYEVIVVDDGR